MYGNGSAANGARLLKVVNFATRVVTGLRKHDHVTRARCDLGLLTPREMCDIRTVIVAHKACVDGLPADLASVLTTHAAARSIERVARQDRLLRPPAMRAAAGQRSFAYRAASLLNKLPERVRGRETSFFIRAATPFFSQDREASLYALTGRVYVCVCVCLCVRVFLPIVTTDHIVLNIL